MGMILLLSIVIRVFALAWSVAILRRLRDARVGLLSGMLAILATRQILTVVYAESLCLFCFDWEHLSVHLIEIPGLVVSILAFLAVIAIKRIIEEQLESRQALQANEDQLRRRNAQLRLLQQVTATCSNATDVSDALSATIEAVCKHADWPVGHAYRMGGASEAAAMSSVAWWLADEDRYAEFSRCSESESLQPGVEFSRRVVEGDGPVWVTDIASDPGFSLRAEAAGAGLCAACAFPVVVGDQLVAVLEFFADTPRPCDDELIKVMSSIGVELGRVFERDRSRRAIDDRKQMLQTIVDNTQSVIYIKDTLGRYLLANHRFEQLFSIPRGKVIGRTDHEIFSADLADAFTENDREVIRRREPVEFEEVAVHAEDGERHSYLSNKFPFIGVDDEVRGICGISMDISQRIKDQNAREEALDKERRARSDAEAARRETVDILEQVGEAFVALDNEWNYRFVNEKAGKILGRRPEDLIGKHIWTEFPEGVGQPFHEAYRRAVAEQKNIYLEEYYAPMDRWFENRIYPSKDGLSIFFHDITDRKRNDERLRFTQFLIDHAGDAVFTVSDDGHFVDVNETACSRLGYSRDELLGMGVWDINVEYPREAWDGLWEEIRTTGGASVVSKHRTKDGRAFPVELVIRYFVYEGMERCCAFARDISVRAQAEENLDRFFTLSLELMCLATADGYFKRVNPQFGRTLGYSDEELLAKPFLEFVDPEDREATLEAMDALRSGNAVKQFANRYVCKDGSRRWLEWNSMPAQGGPFYYAVARDVTARKQAEMALKDTEERFSLFMKYLPGFAYMKDTDHRVVFVNEYFQKAFGRPLDQWVGHTAHETLPAEAARAIFDTDDRVMKNSGPVEVIEQIHHGGRTHHYLTHKFPIFREGRPHLLGGVSVDITDRVLAEEQKVRLEQELRQSQKLDAVGTLAAGIAHDLNNVLAAVFGYVAGAKENLDDRNAVRESLEMIERVAGQGRSVTRALLTFAHKAPLDRTDVELSELVRQAVMMLRRLLPASIEIVENYPDAEKVWVRSDGGLIQQVLVNLFVNARDAFEDDTGRISVTVQADSAPEVDDTGGIGTAVIVVEDNGLGMSDQTLPRVFEPFFTTKSRGAGTGLGLAVAHGIITDHGGSIDAASTEGEGTCITIRLPRTPPPGTPDPAQISETPTDAASRLILLAEDNEFVRPLMIGALESAGYRVAAANDGAEAMERYRSCQDQIALAVLDLDMPKKSGLTCITEIHESGQTLPIVLVTGNVTPDMDEAAHTSVVTLRKPFQMDELIGLVNRLVADESGG